jgi:hypothetical protein
MLKRNVQTKSVLTPVQKMNIIKTEKFKQYLSDKAIDNYPHLLDKLELFWGSDMFCEFFNNILIQELDKKREGFPAPVLEAIQTIIDVHNDNYPEFKTVLCPPNSFHC